VKLWKGRIENLNTVFFWREL